MKTVSRELHRHLDEQNISNVHANKQVNMGMLICLLSQTFVSQIFLRTILLVLAAHMDTPVASNNASSKECVESPCLRIDLCMEQKLAVE